MNVFTAIIPPIGIGIAAVMRSVAVNNCTGVGGTLGLVMGVASRVVMTVR